MMREGETVQGNSAQRSERRTSSVLREVQSNWEAPARTAGASSKVLGAAIETTGVLSKGRDSDSSYAVSGTSSAGTARDTPKPRSTERTRIEEALLIKDAIPTRFGELRLRGCCVSTGGAPLRGGEHVQSPLSYFSTAAAKQNNLFQRANPKSAETLQIGFCQTSKWILDVTSRL